MPNRSPPPSFSPPHIDLRQFYQLFFEETRDNLDQLERMLLGTAWEQATDEDFHALFRSAHSIKGSAATFGFDHIAHLAHHLESVLDLWRKRLTSPNALAINHMLAAADMIGSMVHAHAQEQPLTEALKAQINPITAALRSHYADHEQLNAATPPSAPIAQASAPATTEQDNNLGLFSDAPAGSADIAPPRTEPTHPKTQAVAPEDDPLAAVPHQPYASAAPNAAEGLTSSPLSQSEATMHSVRVPIERVDEIVNLLGELVVAQTSLQQHIQRLEKSQRDGLQMLLDEQQALIRKMRDSVMHIRMVPASHLFKRFPRLIHDLSQRLDKQVQLHTEGDTTELDKGVMERITDPLIHLLRNCMDHGFETPQERLALHKPAEGHLWVRAQTHGSHVALQVQDDGRGLSRQKLLAIAASQGIEVPDNAPDSQVWQLALLPGVSTSQAISDVSGRGVGMDVVKRNIEDLGGRIEIESVAQQGTTITLWLPLTLAITDGLLIQAGAEHYIVPLASVQESMSAKTLRFETLGHRARVVHLHGSYYPVVALDSLMGIARPNPPAAEDAHNTILLLLQAGSHRVGLLVDRLIGQQQVVIKSVETHYRKIPYIAAATVLGNGQVALVLDAPELAAMGQGHDWATLHNRTSAAFSDAAARNETA